MLDESLLIKYEYDQDLGIDLHTLGESLMGFDLVLKDLIDIANLTDKVEVKVSRIEHGSVEVYSALTVLSSVPFENSTDFLEFLKIAAPHLLPNANTFFSTAAEAHKSVNDYFARNQFDQSVVSGLVVAFLIGAFKLAGKLHRGAIKQEEITTITPRQSNRLTRMVAGGRYKRALIPVVTGEASSVELIALTSSAELSTTVTESNIENYMPDEDKVLPQFLNGDRIRVSGELVTLQSTRGDEMKIRLHDVDKAHNIVRCTLADQVLIEDYTYLFKKSVVIDAEIYRKTMYKRPELIIHEMEAQQKSILD